MDNRAYFNFDNWFIIEENDNTFIKYDGLRPVEMLAESCTIKDDFATFQSRQWNGNSFVDVHITIPVSILDKILTKLKNQ